MKPKLRPAGGWALAILLLTCCAGCQTHLPPSESSQQVARKLRNELIELSQQVDPREAEALAQVAVEASLHLAQEYRVVSPAWLHNVMVNYGMRQRGLCFHWTNDLFTRLYALQCKSLELHLAVARLDTPREHNAVLITARGEPFESGVILDAWRNSGRLWSGPVKSDRYPWEPLPPDLIDADLLQLMQSSPAPPLVTPISQ